jgi:hypothetical protein
MAIGRDIPIPTQVAASVIAFGPTKAFEIFALELASGP